MRTEGRAERGTGITKLIVTFRNFAKAPKMDRLSTGRLQKPWLIRATEKRDLTPRQDLAPSSLSVTIFFPPRRNSPSGPRPPHFRGFTITPRHTTLGRTPLHEWSACRRELYLVKHKTHKRQTPISPARFEPAIPRSERPQILALDHAATGIGSLMITDRNP